MKRPLTIIFLILLNPVLTFAENDLPIDLIKLPLGFKIEIYAAKVLNARSMALSPKGTLFVGTRAAGNVYALVDEDKDMKIDKGYVLAQGWNMPNGVAFRNGSLYVAEIHRVSRFDKIEENLENPPKPIIVNGNFPSDTHHGWKFIRFGPDGKLYVPIGGPCNVCEREIGQHHSSIMRMDPNGKNLEEYAIGIRNTVGFDWEPEKKELWFTDNGRDELGNDIPPDELNYAPKPGMHFGFPYCHGKKIKDPEFGSIRSCSEFTPPVQELGPHVASLGMRFYTGAMFPEEYHNQIFIAEHGSWNRDKKIGYRISLVKLKDGKPVSYETFAEGWNQGEKVWGRPVDIEIMPDGSMLVSDDHSGTIYRISYENSSHPKGSEEPQ